MNGLYKTFIYENRWEWFLSGLGYTLLISLAAVLLGLIIGVLAALGKLSKFKPFKWLASLYVDVIRGTPTMVQILIIYYIIFQSVDLAPWIVGALGFAINSGAYIAEIVRGGILSIDKGQTEAGRSLGLTSSQTMINIIMPQTLKNILPALANEFIVLIKETAVIGMIEKIDLLGAAQRVQSLTFDYLYPLLGAAAIYYVVIKILSIGLNVIEMQLRKSDIR
ncbi:MAG: amino acid ABC transporter permease [Oscillospiraceae bacterium]|nr:amino acid ABC transporter permease [Oscillospiraceae bacterium]